MPRPNRYHPYTRNASTTTSQSSSPRHATTPSLAQVLHPMPALNEQALLQPYQHISPGYIKGVTQDGKALAVRSAYQSADGRLHVEMEIVRFPSEDVKFYSGAQISAIPSPNMSSIPSPPLTMNHVDPTLAGLGIRRGRTARKGSASVASSQDGRSVRAGSEECALSTDDEDAEGDVEETSEIQWRAVLEQRRIIRDLATQRAVMGFGH